VSRHPLTHRAPMARALRALLGLALLVAACGGGRSEPYRPDGPDPATRRTPPAGAVVGGAGRYGSHAWLGIPYAAPPVDARRWRAPAPLAPAAEREALRFGPPCPQYTSPFGGVPGERGEIVGSEDCLTLNVWSPPFPPDGVPQGDQRLPVMVWIHGGGNTIGTAAFYEGGHLASSQDVVVVAVQYRLGPFGWLRHPALRAGAADAAEASGNFGTLDLVRALEWVRDNIAAFGGDPDNVTVFGESAGGQNVYTLLLAPQARGLFHRAIAQSGGLGLTAPHEAEARADADPPGHPQSSEEILLRLLRQDGAADREAALARREAMSEAEVAAYLRTKPAPEVLRAYDTGGVGLIDMPRVFADGAVLPDGDAGTLFADASRWSRMPVMLGTNRDEDRLFLFPDPEYVRRWLWILPRMVDERRYLATADHLSRMWKATGADVPASAMRRAGAPVYVYRFDWDEEPSVLGADLSKLLGAAHGFEIPFVFGHFDLGRAGNAAFTDENRARRVALSQAMRSYWAEFARSGDPARGGDGALPGWEPWPADPDHAPSHLVLDTPRDGGIRMEPGQETPERVLSALESDPRLRSAEERCAVLRRLARRGRGFTPEAYAERPECRALPLEPAS